MVAEWKLTLASLDSPPVWLCRAELGKLGFVYLNMLLCWKLPAARKPACQPLSLLHARFLVFFKKWWRAFRQTNSLPVAWSYRVQQKAFLVHFPSWYKLGLCNSLGKNFVARCMQWFMRRPGWENQWSSKLICTVHPLLQTGLDKFSFPFSFQPLIYLHKKRRGCMCGSAPVRQWRGKGGARSRFFIEWNPTQAGSHQ